MKQSGSVRAKYAWTADGVKISAMSSSNGFEYFGNMVFAASYVGLEPESAAFPEGRITAQGGSFAPVFHLADHLGSVRAELDPTTKDIKTENEYMPYGIRYSAKGYGEQSRYQFSGKESQTVGTLGLLDFGARMYDPVLCRWLTNDPLAEKYYSTSPYAYCGGNPVNRIDPNGMAYGDFHDENGNYLGTDGIDDDKKYILKTRQKIFNDLGVEDVKGAGLSAKDVSATKKFIKENSGNTKAFKENSIAYDNSVGLEISSSNMSAMEAEVGRDNGNGGESEANNREYGGTIIDGKVTLATPGNVGNLRTVEAPSILLQNGGLTFHSHPSGTVQPTISNGIMTTFPPYTQHPSVQDVTTSGSRNHLVFGRGNNRVYIYNSSGIQAKIPARNFSRIFK